MNPYQREGKSTPLLDGAWRRPAKPLLQRDIGTRRKINTAILQTNYYN
jgi:hypothetical protein